jgi:hypothetical protein
MGATAENVSASLEQVRSKTFTRFASDVAGNDSSMSCGKSNCVLLRLDMNGFAAPSVREGAMMASFASWVETFRCEAILGENLTCLFAFYFD